MSIEQISDQRTLVLEDELDNRNIVFYVCFVCQKDIRFWFNYYISNLDEGDYDDDDDDDDDDDHHHLHILPRGVPEFFTV